MIRGSRKICGLYTAEVIGTVLRVMDLEGKTTEGEPATYSCLIILWELGICKGPQMPSRNAFHVKV